MSAPSVDLAALGADVDWTDREAGSRTAAAMRPELGRLTELADWLASTQGAGPPRPPARPRLALIGAAPDDPVAGLAAELDVAVSAVPELPAHHADAVRAGVELADRMVDGGTGLAILACAHRDPAAAVAVAVLGGVEPVRVLARGVAATDPQAWMRRAERVRDLRRHAAALRDDPSGLLAELDDPALAAATGFLLQAVVRRTPVLLDGPGAAAAALIAYQAQPRLVRWLAAAGGTPDPAHALAVTTMGLRCVLDLGVETGDGVAGLLAVPPLRAAVRLAREAAVDAVDATGATGATGATDVADVAAEDPDDG